jgi:hypothetical protein
MFKNLPEVVAATVFSVSSSFNLSKDAFVSEYLFRNKTSRDLVVITMSYNFTTSRLGISYVIFKIRYMFKVSVSQKE